MTRMDAGAQRRVAHHEVGHEEQARTEIHESAHQILAIAFGYEPGVTSAQAGTVLTGCAYFRPPGLPPELASMDWSAPFMKWPHEIRDSLEAAVVISLAGYEAELQLIGQRHSREQPVAEEAVAIVEAMPVSDANREMVAAHADDPVGVSDAQRVGEYVQIAHAEDLRAGEAWLRHLQEQTRLMVARYAPQIQEFARALAFARVT